MRDFLSELQIDNEHDIEQVVRRFEECLYAPAEFTHLHHLIVTVCYLRKFSDAEALERMRRNLLHFSGCHNKQGYHETITRFWIYTIRKFIEGYRQQSLPEIVLRVLNAFADKNYIYRFYTRERLNSPKAKTDWVTPDLQTMD